MTDSVTLSAEQKRARRKRNLLLALSIGAFVLLVFAITMTKLQAGVLERPL